MRKFEFKDRTEQIEIAGKIYDIEVSNYEFIKKAQDHIGELEEAQEKVRSGDIDSIKNALESLINFMLDGDFDRIWEAARHNIHNLLDLAIELADIVSKGFEYKQSKYL